MLVLVSWCIHEHWMNKTHTHTNIHVCTYKLVEKTTEIHTLSSLSCIPLITHRLALAFTIILTEPLTPNLNPQTAFCSCKEPSKMSSQLWLKAKMCPHKDNTHLHTHSDLPRTSPSSVENMGKQIMQGTKERGGWRRMMWVCVLVCLVCVCVCVCVCVLEIESVCSCVCEAEEESNKWSLAAVSVHTATSR